MESESFECEMAGDDTYSVDEVMDQVNSYYKPMDTHYKCVKNMPIKDRSAMNTYKSKNDYTKSATDHTCREQNTTFTLFSESNDLLVMNGVASNNEISSGKTENNQGPEKNEEQFVSDIDPNLSDSITVLSEFITRDASKNTVLLGADSTDIELTQLRHLQCSLQDGIVFNISNDIEENDTITKLLSEVGSENFTSEISHLDHSLVNDNNEFDIMNIPLTMIENLVSTNNQDKDTIPVTLSSEMSTSEKLPGREYLANNNTDEDIDDPEYIPSENNLIQSDDTNVSRDDVNSSNMENNEMKNLCVENGNENSDEEITGRKRKPGFSENKKVANLKLRMSGKPYLGYRRSKEGKVFHDQQRGERILGEKCNSKMCEKSKVRFCNIITEKQRKRIFNTFWNNMNWDQRKIYLTNMIEKSAVRRRTVKDVQEIPKRGDTLKYYFIIEDTKRQVCQKMFLQTLGIKKWTVRYWISGDKNNKSPLTESHRSAGMAPKSNLTRPSTASISKKDEAHKFLRSFLQSLPMLPSHYCRKTSSRLYLEPIFTSLCHLYDIYKQKCTEENKNELVLSRYSFEKTFKESNLSLFVPKKDKCDVCSSYEVGNVTDEEYKKHITLKNAAREEKNMDKEKSKSQTHYVFTSDLQAVKLSPCVNASALYYKTKLNVHNFTMYNLGTKEVTCYWFDETSADLEASVFASCVFTKLNDILSKEPKPVVLWSDGCGYQNRNAIFSNALLHIAVNKNVTIEQKYLVKGHTQMECDSVHSNIENKLKTKEIYLPIQYCMITKEARKNPFPYKAKYLPYTFLKNFSIKRTMAYESIRPGRVAGDPTVHDIRAIRYNPCGDIDVKLDFSSDYQKLPRRTNKVIKHDCEFPSLYTSKLRISKSKWKDLQELKFVIPEDCHAFYDNLPYKD